MDNKPDKASINNSLVNLIKLGVIQLVYIDTNKHIDTSNLTDELLVQHLDNPNVGCLAINNLQ